MSGFAIRAQQVFGIVVLHAVNMVLVAAWLCVIMESRGYAASSPVMCIYPRAVVHFYNLRVPKRSPPDENPYLGKEIRKKGKGFGRHSGAVFCPPVHEDMKTKSTGNILWC